MYKRAIWVSLRSNVVNRVNGGWRKKFPAQPQRNLPLRKILLVVIVLVVVFNIWLLMRTPETTNDTPLNNTPETQSTPPEQQPPVKQQEVLIEQNEGPSAPEEEIIAIVTDEKLPVDKNEIVAPKDEQPAVPEEEKITIPAERVPEDSEQERAVIPSEEMALRVVASERVWMRIQLDQKKPYETLLRAGESYTVKAQTKFTIRIGNAGGVELFFNEKPLGNPGKPGEVVDLTLPE